MSDVLKAESSDNGEDDVLNPNIDDSTLEIVYRQIADIILELAKHDFDQIGSLAEDGEGSWSVRYKPLTLNMNELVRCGNIPVDRLPPRRFSTTTDYLLELSEQHLVHLESQRNIIKDAGDCR